MTENMLKIFSGTEGTNKLVIVGIPCFTSCLITCIGQSISFLQTSVLSGSISEDNLIYFVFRVD